MTDKKIGRIGVIKKYFGLPESGARGFMDEIKALNDEDKTELAVGAARNLGLTQDQVAFPLA